MEKYGVEDLEKQQKAELEDVKKRIDGAIVKAASKMTNAELQKQAEELALLSKRKRDLEDALRKQ